MFTIAHGNRRGAIEPGWHRPTSNLTPPLHIYIFTSYVIIDGSTDQHNPCRLALHIIVVIMCAALSMNGDDFRTNPASETNPKCKGVTAHDFWLECVAYNSYMDRIINPLLMKVSKRTNRSNIDRDKNGSGPGSCPLSILDRPISIPRGHHIFGKMSSMNVVCVS